MVVGPSGAGKDTIIRESRQEIETFDNVHFVKRLVTRPCDPQREDHYSATKDRFNEMSRDGEFAVQWSAHDFLYGIPVETIQRVENGDTLIVNGSRAALPDFRNTYSRCLVTWITASADILAQRLAQRNSEDPQSIRNRLSRKIPHHVETEDVIIDNTGAMADSVARFIEIVLAVQRFEIATTVDSSDHQKRPCI